MGAHPSLVPDSFDGQMSYSITNYLKKLKKQVRERERGGEREREGGREGGRERAL